MFPARCSNTCTPTATTSGCSCRPTPASRATRLALQPVDCAAATCRCSSAAIATSSRSRPPQLPGSTRRRLSGRLPGCFDRPRIYTTDPDEHRRFLVLTHAAFMCCQRTGVRAADHALQRLAHGCRARCCCARTYAWDRLFQGARSVLTVHNIGYQGIIGSRRAGRGAARRPSVDCSISADFAAGRINLLRTGLALRRPDHHREPNLRARDPDRRSTAWAWRSCCAARSADVIGILNGVDYDDWDPRHDRYLPQHYGARSRSGQGRAQAAVAAAARPRRRGTRTALIGIVSRLATQKGFDLLFEALPRAAARRASSIWWCSAAASRATRQFFAAPAAAVPDARALSARLQR